VQYKKLLQLIFSLILIIAIVAQPTTFSMSVFARSTTDINADISDTKQQQKEINAKISALEDSKDDSEALKKQIQEKITITEKLICEYTAQIESYNSEIAVKESEIKQKNADLEDTKYIFKQRLRSIYMSGGDISAISMLMSSDDFADLLSRTELTKSISAYDNSLMEKIVETISQINESKAEVESKQVSVTASKKDLAVQQESLNSQISAVNGVISTISSQQTELNTEKQKLQSAVNQYEVELSAALAPQSTVKYSGGAFAWPVNGFYYISSPYGYRTWSNGSTEFHKGIDIAGAGICGKPISAAADGVVLTAGYNTGGYGNYVVIDHGISSSGNRFTTHYGHMSSIAVSAGQTVSKGQTIGYVGTTGQSTGYHLHFEIRINNSTVNPMSYYN